ncbi:MAG: VWA domain-containing protein [Pseudomonadota bacterium]
MAQQHLHYRLRLPQASRFYCLLLDCSASMLKNSQLSVAKALILALAKQVYQERGDLAVVGFKGNEANIIKAPGKFSTLNHQWIDNIEGGGGTPISKAIGTAENLLKQYRCKFPVSSVDCYLISDCRFRELPPKINGATEHTIIDFEEGLIKLAKAKKLAQQWQAKYLHISDFL